ncbi:CheY-like chemotaxis protein [Rhizobium sp. BK650]|nr:CheY-like chemotaxis protein [Rhizobium sp. BK650]
MERADEEGTEAQALPEAAAGEVVLVVEDDPDVRSYSVESLRELGYHVLEAKDGPAALQTLLSHGKVDLIFSDVVLPGGMSGAEVVVKAREMIPTIKALFTTGYSRNAIVHHGRLDKGVNLLTKPFSFEELAARVRDVLDH